MKAPAHRASLPHGDAVAALREALVRVAYDEDGIRTELATAGASLLDARLASRQLGDGPLPTLVRLFRLGVPVPRSAAAEALDPLSVDDLPGVVETTSGQEVTAYVGITPFQGHLFVHDREDAGFHDPDHVTGVNAASRTLATLTVRRRTDTALDLGTGCGVQACLAARHAARVVATDVNPRALDFARLNARLNDLPNVECREGSLFDPVKGAEFGLIVSNPPYVISPDASFVFRDSGRAGDELSREVVGTAPRFLEEGGFATILCNWVADRGSEFERLERWVRESESDAWLLRYTSERPTDYAAKWNEELRLRAPDEHAETVERWIDHYERQGIEAIGVGAVVLRRRNGVNWVKRDAVPLPPAGSAGDQILRVFAAQSRLASLGDDRALLHERFALVEPHRLDQALLYRGGAYAAQEASLVLDDGVGLRGGVDPHAIHVLFALDGDRPLGAVIDDVADAIEVDRALLEEQALATLRRLFELGFVVLNRV